jgi:hypothetical protein
MFSLEEIGFFAWRADKQFASVVIAQESRMAIEVDILYHSCMPPYLLLLVEDRFLGVPSLLQSTHNAGPYDTAER